MKKFLIIFLIIFFTLPGMLGFLIKDIPAFSQNSLDGTEKIYSGRKVSQEFRSDKNNLSIIGVSIKNPNLRDKNNLDMQIYSNGSLVKTVTINGANIGDGAFIKFKFDPIIDSKDKSYLITFLSPDSTK